ncbi:ABC transporter substrate-binding protein [Paenibacillus kyungheensis]|uniref:ABC transporter substrate-binding protein n=1 Tax=Paenibacillus kyungheensis TaxID=1452732 RepID=A0AAX3M1B8_9BACL|nr:ABC transporter substrate-binding protein [Paenibacillus kyungheensis]WCT55887.1 ABC transporter substrate-binding protein [Paenibacillus kyungheensis]
MKKWIGLTLGICMIWILSACGSAPAVTETTSTTEATENKKIASISIFLTGDLMALGIKPAATTTSDYLPITGEQYQGIQYLGFTKEPDMEALIGLQPDEIFIDAEFADKHGLDKFEQIATTHVINLDEGRWQDHLRTIAQIVDRTENAKSFITAYEAKAKEVSTRFQQKIGNGKVLAMRVSAKGFRIYGMDRPLGPILFEDLKLTPSPNVTTIDKNWENISKEILPDLDADAIFVLVSSVDEGSDQVFEKLQSDPIWLGLKAVKNKQIYMITEQPWLDYSASGNLQALEQLEKMLDEK